MKKYLFLFAAISTVFVLTACSQSNTSPVIPDIITKHKGNDTTPNTQTTIASTFFYATIQSIDPVKMQAIVSGTIGNGVMDILVDLSVNRTENFEVGQTIQVGYDGTIMESHPAQIKTISVELVPNIN